MPHGRCRSHNLRQLGIPKKRFYIPLLYLTISQYIPIVPGYPLPVRILKHIYFEYIFGNFGNIHEYPSTFHFWTFWNIWDANIPQDPYYKKPVAHGKIQWLFIPLLSLTIHMGLSENGGYFELNQPLWTYDKFQWLFSDSSHSIKVNPTVRFPVTRRGLKCAPSEGHSRELCSSLCRPSEEVEWRAA